MAVERHAIAELLLQRLPERIAQCADSIHLREIVRKLAGLAEPDRQQRTLGSGATATLMSGTVNQRFELDATAHEKGADPFGE